MQYNPFDVVEENGWVALVTTTHGGHLGWFERETYDTGDGRRLPKRWFQKPVLEWLKATAEDLVDVRACKRPLSYIGEGGWIMQEGNDVIGYKVLATGVEAGATSRDVIQGL